MKEYNSLSKYHLSLSHTVDFSRCGFSYEKENGQCSDEEREDRTNEQYNGENAMFEAARKLIHNSSWMLFWNVICWFGFVLFLVSAEHSQKGFSI